MLKSHEDPILTEKDQEIIAVGASVAAGCLPCTKFHLRAASLAGADEGEVTQAVRDATRVRRAATEIMARAGGLSPVESDRPIPDSEGGPSLIRELVSTSAAYAVNCPSSLGIHWTAARALGATEKQLFAAIKVACAIRDVAVQKAKAVVGAFMGVDEKQAVECDCGESDSTPEERGLNRTPEDPKEASGEDCHCQRPNHHQSGR